MLKLSQLTLSPPQHSTHPSTSVVTSPQQSFAIASTPGYSASSSEMPLIVRSCAQILVQHCLACFGGTLFGRPLADGGDIHVSTDGNFHHCHCWSAGDCLPFYNLAYFLPKTQVDAMGMHIEWQHKKPAKCHDVMTIPDKALDSCESSYEVADGKKQKTSMESFDDTGLMALICQHDIPLFFSNIDSLGEQQQYALALIAYLFLLLPHSATVVTLYNVGCVLDRTLSLVSAFKITMSVIHCFHSMTYWPMISLAAFVSPPQPCMPVVMSGHVNSPSIHTYQLA